MPDLAEKYVEVTLALAASSLDGLLKMPDAKLRQGIRTIAATLLSCAEEYPSWRQKIEAQISGVQPDCKHREQAN